MFTFKDSGMSGAKKYQIRHRTNVGQNVQLILPENYCEADHSPQSVFKTYLWIVYLYTLSRKHRYLRYPIYLFIKKKKI